MFLFWTAANGVFLMENVSNPESIVDLLNGEAKYLSKSLIELIRVQERQIETSDFSESSKRAARYDLTCKVVQEICAGYARENPGKKSPIQPNFFGVVDEFYKNKYAKKTVSSQ